MLKNGTRIEGTIKQQTPGQFVTIQGFDGATRTIIWDTIAEVVVWSGNGNVIAPGAPAVPTAITGKSLKIGGKKNKKPVLKVSKTVDANVTKEGFTLGRSVTCTSDNDPTCKERVQASIGRDGPKASYTSEKDCSKNPGSDVCTETKQMGVSGKGFGASFTKEEVVKLDETKRKSGAVNIAFTGMVGGGFSTDPNNTTGIFISNLDMNLKILGGGKFPTSKGGGWAGFAFEPSIGFVLMSISSGDFTGSGSGWRAGTSAGLQFMKFGKLDEKTLKQRGFGVFLGAFLGYQYTQFTFNGMTQPGSGSESIGPQINLVFPSYNPRTAKYKSSSLNFMILPTGDFVFVTVGFATSF